jgi:hypothetical protein
MIERERVASILRFFCARKGKYSEAVPSIDALIADDGDGVGNDCPSAALDNNVRLRKRPKKILILPKSA